MDAIVLVAGVLIGVLAASRRGRKRGDWTPGESAPSAGQVARRVGRFVRGSGGDGWGGPGNGAVWDEPRKGGW